MNGCNLQSFPLLQIPDDLTTTTSVIHERKALPTTIYIYSFSLNLTFFHFFVKRRIFLSPLIKTSHVKNTCLTLTRHADRHSGPRERSHFYPQLRPAWERCLCHGHFPDIVSFRVDLDLQLTDLREKCFKILQYSHASSSLESIACQLSFNSCSRLTRTRELMKLSCNSCSHLTRT